jgi:PH domain
MNKMGEKGLIKSWKRRWFKIGRSKDQLAYYVNDTTFKSSGGIPFKLLRGVYSNPDRRFAFNLQTPQRVYRLEVENQAELMYWVRGIIAWYRYVLQSTQSRNSMPLPSATSGASNAGGMYSPRYMRSFKKTRSKQVRCVRPLSLSSQTVPSLLRRLSVVCSLFSVLSVSFFFQPSPVLSLQYSHSQFSVYSHRQPLAVLVALSLSACLSATICFVCPSCSDEKRPPLPRRLRRRRFTRMCWPWCMGWQPPLNRTSPSQSRSALSR